MGAVSGADAPSGRDAAAVASRPDAAPGDDVPVLADGVVLIGEISGSGYRTPPSLVRRADGQVIQLTRLLYLVLDTVDGRRTYADIAYEVSVSFGRLVSPENVAHLVGDTLRPMGLLQRADGSQPEVKKANPLLALRFRYVATNPDVTRKVTAPFARLFNPLVVLAFVAAFLGVCWWVMFDKGLASATHEAFYSPGLLLTVFAITVLSAGFHEFGHASAARHGGATPGAMGMGLYLVWPAFYTDVTDSYRLGRAGRVRTDLGGLFFNAIVAVAMFGAWWATGFEALLLIIATQVVQMLRQLAPLVRFDGYHVLADVTGVPDLYHHIKPTLLGLLPHRWGKPETKVLKPWARAVVSLWVLVVVPLLLGSLALMVVAFPRVAATAWDSLGVQWRSFEQAFSAGDVIEMAAELLSIVAIGLPIFGIVYIVVRLVRQISTSVWRSTQDKPAQRGVAILAAVAVVAALVWAWWPDGNSYRPIQGYERGTIQDVGLLSSSPAAGLEPGHITRARTVWPAGEELPTADRPALAVVLVPRDGTVANPTDVATAGATEAAGPDPTGQTWVFPFNRPPAPGEGDNQAFAVNTVDGSTVYDVAFALVWAEGGTTDNVNSAYALASCENCQTVAVAFQVVLVLGETNTVVPQNIAAAVNYNCVECVTYALAKQLVMTVERPLSLAAMDELNALWQKIAAYGEDIADVPLSEILTRLEDFQAQIMTIIERDLDKPVREPTTSPNPSQRASGSTSPQPSPSPSASGAPEPTPGSSRAPANTASSQPSATDDRAPTPSQQQTPTPTPSGSTEPTSPSASSSPASTAPAQ